MNPYDPCVVNKMVNVKNTKIFWQVDDLNILHVDKKEVTRIIKWMKRVYYEDVRVSRGNKH